MVEVKRSFALSPWNILKIRNSFEESADLCYTLFIMNKEEERLVRRFFDLAAQADAQRIYTHTRFLSPLEQSLFLSVKNELPVSSELNGGAPSAIRKLAVFGSEEELGYPFESPVRILHIRPRSEKFGEELSHRDYLGSLMALGIERDLTGDISVRGKEAWVFVLEGISGFLCESLVQVRHTSVICEEADADAPELSPRFQTLSVNVASERLDLLIAAAAGLKREEAKKLLKEERVFINGRIASSAGQKLHAGNELVIRGYGKYIYDGISATSRKGRIQIGIRKYL